MKQTISATANYSKRTFTIRRYDNGKCYAKYRTTTMPQSEFEEATAYTENDWLHFLRTGDYYKVK